MTHNRFYFISGIKTWRRSSSTSTWCLITVKSSMKTIQRLVELVTTWGSSLRSAGRSFSNRQTKWLVKILPHGPIQSFIPEHQVLLFSVFSDRDWGIADWIMSQTLTISEPVVCKWETSPWEEGKKRNCYIMYAGYYYNRKKKKPQRVPEKWGVVVQYHSLSQNTALN